MNKKLSILSLILAMLFVSCKNPLNFKQEAKESQKAYISISANLPGSNARTVLPTVVITETTGLTWELTGEITDFGSDKTFEKSWYDTEEQKAYNNMCSDTNILLDVGNWKFTLTVYNNEGKVLEATLGDESNPFEIKKDVPNELEFVMQEATGENLANGQIEFTLKFLENVVGQVEATLYEYPGLLEVEDSISLEIQSGTATDGKSCSCVVYNTQNLSSGYYKLNLALQQNTGTEEEPEYETITTYSCLIYVAPGLLSSDSYTLESLAKLYPVTFDLNDGYLDGDIFTNNTVTYNKYQKIDLPTPRKPGFEFLGWYKDSSCDDPVQLDGNGKFSITEGITLYAKWKPITVNFSLKGKIKTDDGSNDYDELIENNTIKVPNDVDTKSDVWQYFAEVRPKDNGNEVYIFKKEKNYRVSLTLHSSVETVIAVAAARADMFFTVGTDEKTISFETGCLNETWEKYITIGVATKEADITLTEVKVEEIEYNLNYSLGIMISKEGINAYLDDQNHNSEIVESNYSDGVCNLTLNSTGVTVDLRSYAPSDTGLYTASFNMSSTNVELKTSIYADCADDNASAWNGGKQNVLNTSSVEYKTLLPVYTGNSECTVGIINNSTVTTGLTISELEFSRKETLEDALTEVDKVVAIKSSNEWTQENGVTVTTNSDPQFVNVTITDSFEEKPAWDGGDGYCCRIKKLRSDLEGLNWQWNEQYSCYSVSSTENKQYKVSLNDNCEIQVEEETSSTTNDVGLIYDLSNPQGILLIENATGLENYRKIVNGDITTLNVPVLNQPRTQNVTYQCSAKLQNDVTVSNWVPIGTEENSFYSSFDGGGYSIIIEDMSSADCDYAGLFGCVQNATISNVVVEGEISSESAKYVGGIVAYCVVGNSSTTIKNCVNKANVNLSTRDSSNDEYIAVGGIVGYAEGNCNVENSVNNGEIKNSATGNITSTAGIIGMVGNNIYNITNCVNLGKITGEANVAGIVAGSGYSSNKPFVNIDKCINAGAIDSEYIYLAGISCASNSTFMSTITNCINMGELSKSSKAGIYHNGGSSSIEITYCINVGECLGSNTGATYFAISNTNNSSNVNNCFYDSSKITNADTNSGGTPKSTDDLKIDTPFDESWSEDNWSFDIDRYPLPNIGENIPRGKDGEYWQAVLTAARN